MYTVLQKANQHALPTHTCLYAAQQNTLVMTHPAQFLLRLWAVWAVQEDVLLAQLSCTAQGAGVLVWIHGMPWRER